MKIEFEEELLRTQMEVQEQTMQTIAAEIHDNIGQLLSLTRLTLSTVNILENSEKAQTKITASLDLLSASIKELRQLASVLHAENILSAGLENAIQKELKWISRSDACEVTFTVTGKSEYRIDPKKEVIAFRLIQEILNNIIKHANAKLILVDYMYEADVIKIKISDDGIGFNVKEKISNPTGLGINNLFKRASLIGGDLIIESEIESGTTVILNIPC